MLFRSLYAMVVALSLVAGIEIGYLRWGAREVQAEGNRIQERGDGDSVPVAAPLGPPSPVGPRRLPRTEQPDSMRSSTGRRRKKPGLIEASAAELAECARSGGPLCGIPR
jgi:hypothetical protein